MKVALVFLLTVVVAASMEVECPSPETENLLPNPDDCKTYYNCVGALPVLMPCPADLHFSPKLLCCDWPYRACCDSVYCNSTYCKKTSPCSPTSTTTEPGVVTVSTTIETETVTGEEEEEEDCS